MTLLTLLLHRQGGDPEAAAGCTFTYTVDDGATFAPDSAFTYAPTTGNTYAPDSAFTFAPDTGATYDPCAND